ncbi:DUF2188 domain-containing protein [uncultured Brevundimonas sp.]|uniref:DUF2188 domain-containing protein n=1 Tax=uncultured Brevundimonas sp. TaxID=213418 RepID=UPI003445D70A
MSNNRHVTPRPNGWAVVAPGSQRASAILPTQREAQDRARQIIEHKGGGELRTHGVDGRIRASDTIAPAKDPFPPRG